VGLLRILVAQAENALGHISEAACAVRDHYKDGAK